MLCEVSMEAAINHPKMNHESVSDREFQSHENRESVNELCIKAGVQMRS